LAQIASPVFDAPVMGVPVGILPWRLVYGKTKMAWLPDYEKKLKICLFVSTESTNVTDGQTDTPTDTAWRHKPRLHSIARQKLKRHIDELKHWRLGPYPQGIIDKAVDKWQTRLRTMCVKAKRCHVIRTSTVMINIYTRPAFFQSHSHY